MAFTGLASSPLANARSMMPILPKRLFRKWSPACARFPIVSYPAEWSLRMVAGPT